MIARVGANIEILDCTPEVEQYFEERLTFDNPEYTKRVSRGLWLGGTPEKITLGVRVGKRIIIPFGCLPDVFSMQEKFEDIDNLCPVSTQKVDYGSRIALYDYQEKAAESALGKRQGVIVAPCGAGKTQIGLEIAARLGLRTLWLTHTHDLMRQSMERAKANFTNLSGKDYGTITEGKIDCGNVLTFATVQTMAAADLSGLWDFWDCIITDECHHVCGTPTKMTMFYKVLSRLNARHKFGLTATPQRADGLIGCMFSIIGPAICTIGKEAIAERTCQVKVFIAKTGYAPEMERVVMPDGTISYQKLINELCSDPVRNRRIAYDAMNCNGSCLVLTDRVKHCQELAQLTGGACLTGKKASKADRESALERLRNGEIKVLVATYQLAKEGLDVPNLRNVIFATPQKNETTITQAIGRVERKADGKAYGTVYDYDDDFLVFYGWSAKRKRLYKKMQFDIETVEAE